MGMVMRSNWVSRNYLWLLAGLAVCVAACPAAGQEDPPPLDIPTSALTGALGQQYVSMVRARLEYWRDQIASATAPAAIIGAREGILRDYARYDAVEYQYQYPFARYATEILTPALQQPAGEDDKLAALRQVNLALALSKMSQVTIQPSLEMMVVHSNDAVRYLGWEGYRSARTILLAQGRSETQQFLGSLRTAAAKEESAPVLGGIFEACNISSFSVATVPAATMQQAQRQAFAVLQTNWRRWCERALAGDAEMIRAMSKAIAAVQTLAAGQEDAGKTAALQMVVDVMRCASLAYDEAGAEGPIAQEAMTLLQLCEGALNAEDGTLFVVTKKRGDYVTRALDEKDAELRRVNVPTAVLKWIDELKEFGVVKADFAPPTPPPAPAPTAEDATDAEPAPEG